MSNLKLSMTILSLSSQRCTTLVSYDPSADGELENKKYPCGRDPDTTNKQHPLTGQRNIDQKFVIDNLHYVASGSPSPRG